jgi:hypothetical protein
MILLVLCRDGYLSDGAGPVNLAGRCSPGNAGVVPCAGQIPDGRQCFMFVLAPQIHIRGSKRARP